MVKKSKCVKIVTFSEYKMKCLSDSYDQTLVLIVINYNVLATVIFFPMSYKK